MGEEFGVRGKDLAMLVKVCGLTRKEDVLACEQLGVDFIGFIFHPQSPRCVSAEWVGSLLRVSRARRVGVFVDQGTDEILNIMQKADLDLAQVHGNQDTGQCRDIGAQRVIKVFWPERYAKKEEFQADLDRFYPVCSYFLMDSGTKGGGHNQVLGTSMTGLMSWNRPWILAGGLSAENVQNLIQKLQPDGIDLNSGVENSPGIKNRELLQQALQNIKEYKEGI